MSYPERDWNGSGHPPGEGPRVAEMLEFADKLAAAVREAVDSGMIDSRLAIHLAHTHDDYMDRRDPRSSGLPDE